MRLIDRITYLALFLMLFSPLLSYITFGLMGMESIVYYFRLFVVFFGLIFLLVKISSVRLEWLHYFFIAYMVYQVIWSFYNGFYDDRGLFNTFNLDLFSIFFTLIIVYTSSFSNRFIHTSIQVIRITIILAAVASVIQFFNYKFLDAYPLWNKERAGDEMIGSIYMDRRVSIFGYISLLDFGMSFIPLVGILLGYSLLNKKPYSIYLILAGLASFLTNTRFILISFIILTLMIVVFNKERLAGMMKYIVVSAIVFILLFQTLNFLGYNLADWYNQRLFSEGSIRETTRYKAWQNFLIFFPEKPIWGTGVHMTREIEIASHAVGSSQIHVGYLSHLVSYGVVGSFILFGFWFLLAKKLYRTAKMTNYWGSFFAFVTYLWAQATLVHYSIFFYGLIFALIFDKYYYDQAVMARIARQAAALRAPE